jgi:hypothetical protein
VLVVWPQFSYGSKIYIHIYIYTHTRIYLYVYIHVFIYIYIYVYIYIYKFSLCSPFLFCGWEWWRPGSFHVWADTEGITFQWEKSEILSVIVAPWRGNSVALTTEKVTFRSRLITGWRWGAGKKIQIESSMGERQWGTRYMGTYPGLDMLTTHLGAGVEGGPWKMWMLGTCICSSAPSLWA